MYRLEQFDIDLKGLSAVETPLSWDLDSQFFTAVGGTEVDGGELHVSGSIRKVSGFFHLELCIQGTATVPCDRCLEPMQQPVDTVLKTVVKLGMEDSEQDDVVVVDENEGILNTAWLIYEATALAIPIQHVHQPGDCNDAMMRKLQELSAARSSDADAKEDIDPRWSALLKLKSNKQ